MPPRNLLFIVVTAVVSLACYLTAERNRYASQVSEAMKVITDLYVEEVEPRNLFESAMSGMLDGLDPYSSYISPDVFRQMEQSLDQEFGGVGIEVEKESDDSPILVLSPLFDSPAYRAGLRSGDSILAIDGENTIGMKQRDAITRMRGKPGTPVKLRIRHAGSKSDLEIEIVRAVITVDSLLGDDRNENGTWDFRWRGNPRIGYLRLTSFGQHSAEELSKALGQGSGCPFDAVLLDLRNNAGGLLDSAVATCDLFLDGGRIVSTRGRDGIDRTVTDATPTTVIPPSIPIAVLINRYSASASEIVAACLQDHRRAVVVGERSWGKGTVQNLFRLEGGQSALKLTTATYWRPSGKNIHRRANAPENEDWGVTPDPGFEIKLTDEQMEAVFRARRERDIGRSKSNGTNETSRPGDYKSAPGPEEIESHPPDGAPRPDATVAPHSPGSQPENASTATGSASATDDPQLRRAIQYLEQVLADRAAGGT